ncbi:MAG: aminopeptidase P family protein, partial [Rhodospirillaceae bacterium]|nr:aminopeptidase P family protein [Rhodospirillaceae bacterium]
MYAARITDFRRRLAAAGFDAAIISDDDNIYYLTGFYDYLHMDFGRPTLLVVPRDGKSVLITPSMELDMAQDAAHVDRIAAWNDGLGNEWREELPALTSKAGRIGIEFDLMPPMVRNYVDGLIGEGPGQDRQRLGDVVPVLSEMRMVKSAHELQM